MFSQEVSVADGATLTIGTSGSMTVTSSITTNNTGTILITTSRASSGSLIAKSAGADQGKGITLRREVDGSNEWTLIGIPVIGENSADIDDDLRTDGSGNSAIGHFDPASGQGEYV